ncbi:hypothetical protein B0H19DRAFT_1258528 [Mycena capillaripes]|nr:hypothetical protein B0H19DRAFT_1258528 [Mycena capillaripes]
MFHTGFAPVVITCAAIGFKLYRMALVEPPMGPLLEDYLQSCTYSNTNPFHDLLCIVEPFFKQLLSNEIGKSFLTAFGASGTVLSSYHVLSTYLFTMAGERGGSPLFSPLIIVALQLAGQAFGLGIVGPIVIPLLSAISKSFTRPNTRAPSSPTYVYTVTHLCTQFAVFLLSLVLCNVPLTSTHWVHVDYVWQAFPLFFLPLAFFSRSFEPPSKGTLAPIPTLTISVFTVYKYIYAPAWWAAIGKALNAYYRHGETFNLACYFMALDVAGFVVLLLGIYALDAVAGEAQVVMSVEKLLGGFIALGPASTMAAYFEGQQRLVVEREEAERARKVRK